MRNCHTLCLGFRVWDLNSFQVLIDGIILGTTIWVMKWDTKVWTCLDYSSFEVPECAGAWLAVSQFQGHVPANHEKLRCLSCQ